MIAPIKPDHTPAPTKTAPEWHARFFEMLPAIRRQAHMSFHDLQPHTRREAVDEVVALVVVAVARLAELGKLDLAYPTPLAQFAIKQVRDGRQVGCRHTVRDVMSRYAQQQRSFRVGRLDHFDAEDNAWLQILVEDKRATPADTAACRIDFAAWLGLLSARRHKIAQVLATGESTSAVARQFRVSPARISQIRRELHQIWQQFQGEELPPARQLVPA
jgi:hypothetical protein